jgi:2-polyprenyl-3-methyl-5-hydroxy-6-metoxy-1,4-benzoquinol methylase
VKVLELGCGMHKTPGAIGIDINPRSQADLIHDLNRIPYPFPDDEFDEVICADVLEHLDDVVAVMHELYRLVKDGGLVRIRVPFPSGSNYPTDITHRRAFTSRSFDYFVPGTQLYDRYAYSGARFERVQCRYHAASGRSRLRKWLLRWAERHKEEFERRYMYLLPVEDVSFVLRARKSDDPDAKQR